MARVRWSTLASLSVGVLAVSLAGCPEHHGDDTDGGDDSGVLDGATDDGSIDDGSVGDGGVDAGDGGTDSGMDGAVDTTPPTVTATNPTEGAEEVPTTAPITVTFDEAMDPSTLAGAITVLGGHEPPYGVLSYDATTHTATWTPSGLEHYQPYAIHVGTGVRDLAGNALAAEVVVHFTTVGTGPVPHVLGVYPFEGDTYASVHQSPYVELDTEMDLATVQQAFTLRRTNDGVLVPGTVSQNLGELVTVRFDPTDDLTCPTTYTAELTTAARSAGGRRLPSTVTFTFTTACPRFGVLIHDYPEEEWWTVFGRVTDDQNRLDCGSTGFTCYATYTVGTTVTLTATPSVSGVFYGWSGPAAFCTGNDPTVQVSLAEDASAECKAVFGPAPGFQATLSVTYGPWIDRIFDATSGSPRIDCGPAPNPSVCSTTVLASDATSLELAATKNVNAPAGTITWTCTQANLVDPPSQSQFTRTGTSIGPFYLSRDTSCHVELVPNPP